MSEIGKSIDECIKLGMTGFLKSHGFKKNGRTWLKQVGDSWQIVNLQSSTRNIGSEGQFAINIGVYQNEIESFCGRSLKGKPKEYDSTIRIRLGGTLSNSDFWWVIDSGTDLRAISNDVVSKLENQGVPWLDDHIAIKTVSSSLANQPSIQSFSAALLSGDEGEAIRRVRAAIVERPRAVEKFRKWAADVGLDV